nr:LytTR family transcriptional regulator [Lachnospiraceae bacterium]
IIKGKEEINFVDIKDIIMIERTDGVTRIVTDTDVFLTSQSLSALEEKLDSEKFMRCHKSYIIRKDAVRKLEVYGRWTYVVKLKGSEETALMTAEKYKELAGM